MQLQFDIIKSIFEVRYAPGNYKSSHLNWDLNISTSEAKQHLANLKNPTVKDFQHTLKKFLHTCQDYHVDVFFYSTEAATLPFRIIPVEGKYLLCHFDADKLPFCHYPWHIGDEIIAFEGQPIQKVIDGICNEELCNGRKETDRALAAEILTKRSALQGQLVPSGSAEITFFAKGQERTYYVPWQYTAEQVTAPEEKQIKKRRRRCPCKSLFQHQMILPSYAADIHEPDTKDKFGLGCKQSYLPKLGPVWWSAPGHFHFDSYLFELPNRKLAGYIRIPHYKGTPQHLDHFGLLIDFYQKNADVLVIDQQNNPGGSPVHLYAMAAMLTNKPLTTVKHRLSLSYHEATSAATVLPLLDGVKTDKDAQKLLGNTIEGYPVTLQTVENLKKYLRFIQEEWSAGKTLSDPFPLYGIEKIQPHKFFRFTKPILVLVNHLDFSGGDFFPALLQDNDRAVIFGETTAGAGGMFTTYSHPNPFGIRSYHVTISIAEREEKGKIENIGVTPDIHCALTAQDIQNDYQIYTSKIVNALEGLTNGRTPAP